MSHFDLQNPDPNAGDAFRDHIANVLSRRFGNVKREVRSFGKKSDLYFEYFEFGKKIKMFIEAKDYNRNLSRDQLVNIWLDYSGIICRNRPSLLLLVTKMGLSSDAQAYVDEEQGELRHQTIWELENDVLGLVSYVKFLDSIFDQEGLSSYYVECKADRMGYEAAYPHVRGPLEAQISLFHRIGSWIENDDYNPVAILGGYGAGKSSFAKRIASSQATKFLSNPLSRQPILIKIGALSRYSSIEGLLGAMFTFEFPVDRFNARQFLSFNEEGRLLIILDGFDEMKHAMSWSDFRSQIADLNRLTFGKSKVILLGRPSSLISSDEHMHVFRGVKKYNETLRRLPDWPEFTEYDLREFDVDERSAFVCKYLDYRYRARSQNISLPLGWVKLRSEEINMLADEEKSLFSRPVHVKILTDLGSDPNTKLESFAADPSRWNLYQLFFTSLAEREVEKEARRPIDENSRLNFLRQIAFWLWTAKNGSTSFVLSDLPAWLLQSTFSKEEEYSDSLIREYLTGAFLEKKGGDVYYFAHRSLVEFLVAERMILVPPVGAEHSIYSLLAKDGVANFLRERQNREIVSSWSTSISGAHGTIHLEYLDLVSSAVGGTEELSKRIPKGSPLQSVLKVFHREINVAGGVLSRIIDELRICEFKTFFVMLSLYQRSLIMYRDMRSQDKNEYACELTSVIIDRLLSNVEIDDQIVIHKGDFSLNKKLIEEAVPDIRNTSFTQSQIRFDGKRLARLKSDLLLELSFDIAVHPPKRMHSLSSLVDVSQAEIVRRCDRKSREKLRKLMILKFNWNDILSIV